MLVSRQKKCKIETSDLRIEKRISNFFTGEGDPEAGRRRRREPEKKKAEESETRDPETEVPEGRSRRG